MLLDTTVDCIDHNDDGWLLWTSAGKIHARQLIVATGHQNTPVHPRMEGAVGLQGRAAALGGLPEPGAIPRQEGPGRRVRQLGDGDRPRPRRGRSQRGPALGADPAEHHSPGGHVRRGDRLGSLQAPAAGRRCGHPVQPPPEHRRPERVRAPGPRGGPVLAPAATRPGAADPERRGDRVDQGAQVRSRGRRRVSRRDRRAARRRRADRARRGDLRHRLPHRPGAAGRHLGVLDEQGLPKAVGGKPAAPGLRFVGYVPRPAGIYYFGREAKRAAKAIARELRRAADSRRPPTPPAPRASASALC